MDKKKHPPIIDQYNPILYPFKLWVAITENFTDVTDKFVTARERKEINLTDIGMIEGMTEYVMQKEEDMYYGVLIIFPNTGNMTLQNIAHEASHAADVVWHHLGEAHVSGEANAYLTGWIAKCIGDTYNDLLKNKKRHGLRRP
jgi:hypothetical protein